MIDYEGRKYYTSSEVADILNVNIETIRRWVKGGKLKARKVGRSYYIPLESIDKMLAPAALKELREKELREMIAFMKETAEKIAHIEEMTSGDMLMYDKNGQPLMIAHFYDTKREQEKSE